MPRVAASVEIPGLDVSQVWSTVSDPEGYPRLAEHVVEVARTGDGEFEWRVLLNGSLVTWVQHEVAEPPMLLAFEQVRGDMGQLRGRWILRPQPSGVWLGLELEFSLGVDGLAPLLDPIWEQCFRAHANALVGGVARAHRDHDSIRTT